MYMYMCAKNEAGNSTAVCVLGIKPFFLPVDIQHNLCPCRFFNPTRYEVEEVKVMWSQSYATDRLHCHVPATWYAVSTAVGNEMPWHNTN